MRRPDESRCIEVASDDCDIDTLRWASSDAMLVLIVSAMMIPVDERTKCSDEVSGKSTGVMDTKRQVLLRSDRRVSRFVGSLATHRTQARVREPVVIFIGVPERNL
jgi:hypothetical protein